jgi:hypothetical protein
VALCGHTTGLMERSALLIHLYGFLEGDFVGRLVVADTDQRVGALGQQLRAWGPDLLPPSTTVDEVVNEKGTVLDPTSTLGAAGLCTGDIFRVRDVPFYVAELVQ